MDSDIDLAPWLALTEEDLAGASGLIRVYYRWQWLVLPLLLAGNAFNMQFAGVRFVVGRLCFAERGRGSYAIDAAALALHFTCWLLLPMLVFSVTDVSLFYAVRNVLFGYAMFAVLAPAHLPKEARIVAADAPRTDRVAAQILTSINFRAGRIGSFFCSGLNYQIEHHLFPTVSPVHYPAISVMVRQFCADLGYPYHSLGWGRALGGILQALYEPRRVSRAPLSGERNV